MYEIAVSLGVDMFHLQYGIFTTENIVKKCSKDYQKDFNLEPPDSWKGFVRDVSEINPAIIKRQVDAIRSDIIKSGRKIMYRETPTFEFDLEKYYKQPKESVSQHKCTIPWKYLQVMPNSDLALCVDFVNVIIGNISNDKLENLWNGKKARMFRRYIRKKGPFTVCNRCDSYMETKTKVGIFLQDSLKRLKNLCKGT